MLKEYEGCTEYFSFLLTICYFLSFPIKCPAYLCLPLTSAIFIGYFPIAFICLSLIVDPSVCWPISIIPETFVPLFSTCSLLNALVSPFVQSILIVKDFLKALDVTVIVSSCVSSALRWSVALFYTGFFENYQFFSTPWSSFQGMVQIIWLSLLKLLPRIPFLFLFFFHVVLSIYWWILLTCDNAYFKCPTSNFSQCPPINWKKPELQR